VARQQVLLIGTEHEVTRKLARALAKCHCSFGFAAGDADALRQLRSRSFDVVVTNLETTIEEDLALLEEMRRIRPGVKAIVLARASTPENVIAALRARVFSCFIEPLNIDQIAEMASHAAAETDWREDIEVISAHRGWVSVRANCRLLTAERLIGFLRELRPDVQGGDREDLMLAFREILLNAMEHGAGFRPGQVVEVAAVRTARTMVFYVRDAGAGFDPDSIPHSALTNPPNDPRAHLHLRLEQAMRFGGYGILMARKLVDELIYSEVGNEVLLIKHLD
jgi:ActR/RegA family two-component response regulator/anti-sigma regulatory factor (Ser/Thr protein kinase)